MKKKKIVVFGGAGFLGRYLIKELLGRGYETVCYDLKKLENPGSNNFLSIVGSIFDKKKINEILKGVDYVYHLAALQDIDDCLKHPIEAIKTNVYGASTVLDCCTKNNVKRFIFSSSVYANGEKGGIYGAGKKAVEIILKEYSKNYGINYTILQYGTLYGPGSEINNSIHRYLDQAIKKRKIVYNGDGEELREYIHIKDASILSVKALDKKNINKTLILTGPNPTKIKDLFLMIDEILGGIKINYKKKTTPGRKMAHYKFSPYSYQKTIPEKIINNTYRDLGSGLIEVCEYISSLQNKKEIKKIRKHSFDDEKKNIGVDFDGVIHTCEKGYYDGTIYGKVIPGTKKALKKLSEKYDIILFTTKAREDRPLINGKTGEELVWEWLEKNKLSKYIKQVTSEKPRAVAYIDDKAIKFRGWYEVLKRIF